MRILHLDSGPEMRGGQRQVLRLIEGLRSLGHRNVLLARAGSPLLAEAQRHGLATGDWNLPSVMKQSRKADITHAHDARSHAAAAVSFAPRLVVSRRVAFPVRRHWYSRWKYKRAVHYIAVSEHVKRVLIEGGVAPSRVAVVYDGVEMQPQSTGSEIVIPYSADPAKAMDLAVESVRLAGFPARVSRDLEKDLPHAGLFVYLTHSEGLGSAVLLAMAAGVPVIASNVGGLPEIIEPERTGLLTENVRDDVARAVRRLIGDRALAQSLGAQARCWVQQRFSVDRMIQGTLRVYESVR